MGYLLETYGKILRTYGIILRNYGMIFIRTEQYYVRDKYFVHTELFSQFRDNQIILSLTSLGHTL